MPRPIDTPGTRPGAARSAFAAVAAAAAALGLGRTTGTWAGRDAQAFLTVGGPVDEVVALVAVGIGALAAGVLAAGCALLALGGAAEHLGRALRARTLAAEAVRRIGQGLDAAGSRLTPLVLRRALAIGLGAGLGLAGPATVAIADEADLGWAVTATAEQETGAAPAEGAPGAPAEAAPGEPAGTPATETSAGAAWEVWPVSDGTGAEHGTAGPEDATAAHDADVPAGTAPSGRRADDRVPASLGDGPGTVLPAEAPVSIPAADPAAPGTPDAGTVALVEAAGSSLPAGQTTTAGAQGARATDGSRTAATAPVAPGPAEHTPGGRVVVRSGDSLWSLAAAALGPAASDEQIAEAWPRWYAANQAVIGTDPSLIHPGQELIVPRDVLTVAPLEETP